MLPHQSGVGTFENLDVDSRLIILVGGEDLGLLGWDDCVAADQLCHDTAHCLDSEGQWCDVQQQKILPALTTQDSCLNCSTICNCLVRVDGQ